jgi:deoxyribodipyrimidine photo-lyase
VSDRASHQPYGIHWFRRDLRIAGNPALQWSREKHQGRVLGFFCFDHRFLSRPDFSVNRFQFFLDTLAELARELRSLGGDLLVRDVGPETAFAEVLTGLRDGGVALPQTCSWNRDYEPFARERDAGMQRFFENRFPVAIHTERDHLLIEPHEIRKSDDRPYQVFSPFSRAWLARFHTPQVQERLEAQARGLQFLEAYGRGERPRLFRMRWADLGPAVKGDDCLEAYRARNRARVTVPIPKAGALAAYEQLRGFQPRLARYAVGRDLPAEPGTSRLSIYLKNGSLTVSQAIAAMCLGGEKAKAAGAKKFLSELIWREFYYAILTHYPHVEHGAFRRERNGLKWENREDWFAAWKEGRTGFPIVDAGMRELKHTGWMHNRVRMIVASFLTKDLLIDWRWGEQHFMNQLLDGDLAPNNGGWQWAASTGCDPQPYFRIFNPVLQSRRFDPRGIYLRRYLPELSGVTGGSIHGPGIGGGYLKPLVEHAAQREKALRLFRQDAGNNR